MAFIRDLKSCNGTFVDGLRVDRCTLLTGKPLRIADMTFEVIVSQGEDQADSSGRFNRTTIKHQIPQGVINTDFRDLSDGQAPCAAPAGAGRFGKRSSHLPECQLSHRPSRMLSKSIIIAGSVFAHGIDRALPDAAFSEFWRATRAPFPSVDPRTNWRERRHGHEVPKPCTSSANLKEGSARRPPFRAVPNSLSTVVWPLTQMQLHTCRRHA